MNRCIVCNQVLDKTHDSAEHILLESLGDKNPVKGLICKSCNNLLGTLVDQKFEQPLKPLYESLSSRSTEMRVTYTGDGRDYYAKFINGQLRENAKYRAVKPLEKKTQSGFSFKFLDIDDAKQELEKVENRLQKKGKKVNLTLQTSRVDPQEAGVSFQFTPEFDKRYVVLEAMKMQMEYLRSIGRNEQTFSQIMIQQIVKNYRDSKQPKVEVSDMLEHLDTWLFILFDTFQMGSLFRTFLSAEPFIEGQSSARVTQLPNNDGEWTVFYLFGKFALWFPILSISNLYKMFGENFVELLPIANDERKNIKNVFTSLGKEDHI